MPANKHILDFFPSYIFWDVHPEQLDISLHSEYIIEKTMMACADLEDFNITIQKLEILYPFKHIKDVVLNSKEFIGNSVYYTKKRYNTSRELINA